MQLTVLLGGGRSYVILILANLNHLQHLHLETYNGSPLRLDVLELLSSRKYLPKLAYYTYSERLSIYNQDNPFTPTSSPKLRSEDKVNPEESPLISEQANTSVLEEIVIDYPRADMGMVAQLLRIPFALKTFSFSSTNEFKQSDSFTLVKFQKAVELQSHSLQDLTLALPNVHWPRTGVLGEDMSLTNLKDFRVLKTLTIPFDALFGPEPSVTVNFNHLLPNSLEELNLRNCMFIGPNSHLVWSNRDIRRALVSGAVDLASQCPQLQRVTITCLIISEFKEFKEAVNSQKVVYEVMFAGSIEFTELRTRGL